MCSFKNAALNLAIGIVVFLVAYAAITAATIAYVNAAVIIDVQSGERTDTSGGYAAQQRNDYRDAMHGCMTISDDYARGDCLSRVYSSRPQ